MSEHIISLRPGDTLTIAHVSADDELQTVAVAPAPVPAPVPVKSRKGGCRRKPGETDEQLQARKDAKAAKATAPVAGTTPLESLIESAPAPVETKPKSKQVPLCKAVAIVNYTSKEGKVSDVVLWKMGKNKQGDWYRMRWLAKDDNEGFATFKGFWGKKAGFNSVVVQGDDLKQRCGCEDCLKLRKAAA